MSRKSMDLLLRINILCYILPLIFIGEVYKTVFHEVAYAFGVRWEIPTHLSPRDLIFLEIESDIRFSLGLRWEVQLLLLYGLIAFFVIVWGLYVDYMAKAPVQDAVRRSHKQKDKDFQQLKDAVGIRKDIDICDCREGFQISTIGMLHPIIFFHYPQDGEAKEFLMLHELYHVKRGDVFWRGLAKWMNRIHFYNPLCYFLRREFEEISEMSCDEWVIRDYDYSQKRKYAEYLAEYSVEQYSVKKPGIRIFYGGTREKQAIMRRMDWILNGKKKRLFGKGATVLLVAALLWVSSLTTLAYDSVQWWTGEEEAAQCLMNGESDGYRLEVFYYDAADCQKAEAFMYPDRIVYEEIVYTDEGILQGEEAQPRDMICLFHDYESVVIVEHFLNTTDGSCQAKYYDAERCKKCGKVRNKVLQYTVNYYTCPHNN